MKVSVIVPCYNEQRLIKTSITALLKSISTLDSELIVVNDGSTDGTLGELRKLASSEPKMTVMSYPKNRGRGYAMRAGFREASGDIIVTTEADSSWGADIVMRLVNALEKNPQNDFVIASPHRKGGGYANVPKLRVLLSSIGNRVLSKAVGHGVTMSSGMTRAYRSYVVKELPLEQDRKEIHLEILSKALDLGYSVMEIPAVLKWKSGRGKRKSGFKAKRLIMTHLLFSFNESPILLLGTLSIVFIALGLSLGLFFTYQWLIGGLNPDRPLMTIMVLLLITGLLMIIFTFLAYQNRMLRKELLRAQAKGLQQSHFRNVQRYKR